MPLLTPQRQKPGNEQKKKSSSRGRSAQQASGKQRSKREQRQASQQGQRPSPPPPQPSPAKSNKGNDTSWTHSESSFDDVDNLGEGRPPVKNIPTPLYRTNQQQQQQQQQPKQRGPTTITAAMVNDNVSSIHFGESVTNGITNTLVTSTSTSNQKRNRPIYNPDVSRSEVKAIKAALKAHRAASKERKQQLDNEEESPFLLLDTLALANHDKNRQLQEKHAKNNDNQHASIQSKRGSSFGKRASSFGKRASSLGKKKSQQVNMTEGEHHTSNKPIDNQQATIANREEVNILSTANDDHTLIHNNVVGAADSPSAGLLNFVSNMTLRSSAGALTSSAVGLSLLTTMPLQDKHDINKNWAKSPVLMVRESIDRHIKACIDHCSLSPSSASGMAQSCANAVLTGTPEAVDEVALQLLAAEQPHKALDIFRILLQNQRKQRGKPSTQQVVIESEIAQTKSRLAGLSLLLAENSSEALQYTVSALQAHKKAGRPIHVTLSTVELGLIQFGQENFPEALKAWREALQLACMTLGYEHQQVAILLNNIGILRFYLGDVHACVRALEESLGLQRQLLRSDVQSSSVEMPLFQLATTTSNLAIVSARIKNYDAAVNFLEEAIAIQDSVLDTKTTNRISFVTEKYLELFTTLRDTEVDNTAADPDNSLIADESAMTSNSSSNYNGILQPKISIFGDIDGIPLRHDGNNRQQASCSPLMVEDSNIYDCIQLGSLVKPATAKERIHATVANALERVVRTAQQVATSVLVDDATNSIAARKKQSIPVDLDREAVIDAEFFLEEIHLQALDHISRNEYKDALDLFESALRDHKEKYGEIHHLVGTGLHNCGIVHMVSRDYRQAKMCFQEAIGVRVAALGDSHPDAASSLCKLGMIQMASGEYECALSTFMDIANSLQKNMTTYGFAPEAIMLNNIGVVLYEMGRDVDAFQSCFKAYNIQKGLLKDCSHGAPAVERALAKTLSNLGYIYAKQGQFNDAFQAYKEALAIVVKYHPVDHSHVVMTEENIALVKAYGGVDVEEVRSHEQSKLFDCVQSGKDVREPSKYGQSKLSACFQLQ